MIRAAPSRLTYMLNHSGSTSWNRCHQPGRFASSASSTNAVTSSPATPYAVSRICTYGIFSATSAVSIRRTVAGATRSTRAASSRPMPAASRSSCSRLPSTTWPTVGAARRSLTPRLPNAPKPAISLSRTADSLPGPTVKRSRERTCRRRITPRVIDRARPERDRERTGPRAGALRPGARLPAAP